MARCVQGVLQQRVDFRVATQDAVEEHDVVFVEMDLGRVADPERRAILDHPLSGECARVLDRS